MRHNQSGVRDIFLPSPCLDVGESCELPVFGNGYHSLSCLHFPDYIFGSPPGYARASLLRRYEHLVAYFPGINRVATVRHHYINLHLVIYFLFLYDIQVP